MPQPKSWKVVRWCVGVYLLLWLLTATWGASTADRAFNRDLAFGYGGFSDAPQPVVRIPYTPEMQKINDNYPTPPLWKARSKGVAVAPFVILDAAAWVDGSMSGYSGYRATLWFFGASRSFSLRVFWVA